MIGERGGVIFPMWQSEAMWINFTNEGPDWHIDFPVAIKIAAGKINAVTGEPWRAGLHRRPQDYLYSPEQPWLDGFAVEKGVIRQFVAMPLGAGYSAEEQITGKAEWGGLQILVAPLKKEVWTRWHGEQKKRGQDIVLYDMVCNSELTEGSRAMALAPGGRMRQHIYPDPFKIADWDFDAAQRLFVTILDSVSWSKATGESPPTFPPTAKEYSQAGLPWFDWYGKDHEATAGSAALAGMKSVGKMFKGKTGATLPHSEDVDVSTKIVLGRKPRRAREIKANHGFD